MCRNLVCVGRPEAVRSGTVLFTATAGMPPSYGKQLVSRHNGLSGQKKDMRTRRYRERISRPSGWLTNVNDSKYKTPFTLTTNNFTIFAL